MEMGPSPGPRYRKSLLKQCCMLWTHASPKAVTHCLLTSSWMWMFANNISYPFLHWRWSISWTQVQQVASEVALDAMATCITKSGDMISGNSIPDVGDPLNPQDMATKNIQTWHSPTRPPFPHHPLLMLCEGRWHDAWKLQLYHHRWA